MPFVVVGEDDHLVSKNPADRHQHWLHRPARDRDRNAPVEISYRVIQPSRSLPELPPADAPRVPLVPSALGPNKRVDPSERKRVFTRTLLRPVSEIDDPAGGRPIWPLV